MKPDDAEFRLNRTRPIVAYGVEIKKWHCEDVADGWDSGTPDGTWRSDWASFWRTVRDLMLAGF